MIYENEEIIYKYFLPPINTSKISFFSSFINIIINLSRTNLSSRAINITFLNNSIGKNNIYVSIIIKSLLFKQAKFIIIFPWILLSKLILNSGILSLTYFSKVTLFSSST